MKTAYVPLSAKKIQRKLDKDHKKEVAAGFRHVAYCKDKKMYVKCGVCRTSLSIGNSASGNIGNFTKHVTSSQHDEKWKKAMSPASTNKEKEKENPPKDDKLTEAQALEKVSLSVKNGKLFCRPCKFTFKLVDSHHVISHLKGKVHLSNKAKFGGIGDVSTFLKKPDEQSA